jgi:hypothetical protein
MTNSSNANYNLDRWAAFYGQKVIEELVVKGKVKPGDVDNTVTKALGVLQENGVYACFLYLLAKEDKNGGVVIEKMLNLLKELGFGEMNSKNKDKPEEIQILTYIMEKVTTELERLLLAKEILEKMLIYARYGAKAC